MNVAKLIERLQALPGDIEVVLNFDRIGVLPLNNVKQMGAVTTRVRPGGFVDVDRSKAKIECHLVARVPASWRPV